MVHVSPPASAPVMRLSTRYPPGSPTMRMIELPGACPGDTRVRHQRRRPSGDHHWRLADRHGADWWPNLEPVGLPLGPPTNFAAGLLIMAGRNVARRRFAPADIPSPRACTTVLARIVTSRSAAAAKRPLPGRRSYALVDARTPPNSWSDGNSDSAHLWCWADTCATVSTTATQLLC